MMTGPAFPVPARWEVPDDPAVPVRRGRDTVEYEIILARWPEESGVCVSRSTGQAASEAISAAGSPWPERECALSRAADGRSAARPN